MANADRGSAAWDPLKDLMQVQKRMNQLFESALARSDFETQDGLDSWTPVCDVYETASSFVARFELPGLEREAIDVRIEKDELVVEGERRMDRADESEQFHRVEREYGRFSRRVRLPSGFDPDAVEASFRHGVLTVRVPTGRARRPGAVRVAIR